jgi:enolase-phosphatase E1
VIEAIVTDIEGTTTSVSFVYDVLFPYARKHMSSFISKHRNDQRVISQLALINKETGKELDELQAIQQLLQWMDEDRKISPLKTIQGLIWEDGYNNGNFTGHIYNDVPPVLKQWRDLNISLYVYSSGSVAAQKLLFSHTEFGDLTPYFTDFFDTEIGNKKEPLSYSRITETLAVEPNKILFISDITDELAAAEAAGIKTILIDREGINKPGKYILAQNFNEIQSVINKL